MSYICHEFLGRNLNGGEFLKNIYILFGFSLYLFIRMYDEFIGHYSDPGIYLGYSKIAMFQI